MCQAMFDHLLLHHVTFEFTINDMDCGELFQFVVTDECELMTQERKQAEILAGFKFDFDGDDDGDDDGENGDDKSIGVGVGGVGGRMAVEKVGGAHTIAESEMYGL